MPQPLDILDKRDPLTLPFIGSIVLHACIVAVLFLYWFWTSQKTDQWGEQKSGGQAYAVSVAHSIPIPQHDAPPNPVAHDTDSLVPTAPAEKEVKKEPPPPMVPPKDAFEIPDRLKPQKQPTQQQKTYTVPAPPNQVYSQTKQALSNPMYAPPAGGGQVGIGPNSMLGNRFGAYAQLIRDRLLQNWQTNGLHSQATDAVVDFEVLNGRILSSKIVQSSGNFEIDQSALRAVAASDPLTPFPPALAGTTFTAEFTFNIHQR